MKRLLAVAGLSILLAATAYGQGFPAQNLTTSQVSCGTSATLISSPRYRNAITIKDPTGGVTVFVGAAGVTTTSGLGVDPGTAMTFQPYAGGVYCVVATGTQTVNVAETY